MGVAGGWTSTVGDDVVAVFDVRGEHAVVSGEMGAGASHGASSLRERHFRGGEAGDKVHRVEHDMSRLVMKGVLEPIHDLPAVIDREAFVRDGWAGDVAAARDRKPRFNAEGARVPNERSWPCQSDRIPVRPNERCRSDQTQAFECIHMFVRGSRWISQRRPVAANGREHSLGVGNEQIGDEHVGMLRRQIVGREALRREVPQVPSHDRVRTGFNRGGQHMDVVRVWQIETSGTCRVSCHNRIGKVPVHYRAGSFQHVHREIGPVRENATYPLRMDVHAPSRRIEVLVGQSQEKIRRPAG